MRRFSFRAPLTLRGRKFKGPRGWAGKPFHPPLTDIPIGAYLVATAFDVISRILGTGTDLAHDLYRAATFAFIAGLIVTVPTVVTGFWDWWRSSEPGTQARRTINAHAWVMITATVLVLVNVILRHHVYEAFHTPGRLMVLSLVIAGVVVLGGIYGGALVYEYGFNVETAGDSPVWHKSEHDVGPGAG